VEHTHPIQILCSFRFCVYGYILSCSGAISAKVRTEVVFHFSFRRVRSAAVPGHSPTCYITSVSVLCFSFIWAQPARSASLVNGRWAGRPVRRLDASAVSRGFAVRFCRRRFFRRVGRFVRRHCLPRSQLPAEIHRTSILPRKYVVSSSSCAERGEVFHECAPLRPSEEGAEH